MKSLAEIQLEEWLKNAHQIPLLKEGVAFEVIEITAKDAEFLEKVKIPKETP